MSKQPEIQEIDIQIKQLKDKKHQLDKNAWDWSKLGRGLALWIPKSFGKFLATVFHNLLIAAIVFGIIFGVGFWKGSARQPVLVNAKDRIILVSDKFGNRHEIEFRKGKMLFDGEYVKRGDIEGLKPYGLHLKPKMFAGLGTGGASIGAGLELAHFYRLNLDVFGMSDKAVYCGVSYDIDAKSTGFFSNSAIGLGLGKSLENVADTRILLYGTIRF